FQGVYFQLILDFSCMQWKNRPVLLFLFFVLLIVQFLFLYSNHEVIPEFGIKWDGKGYYRYLTSIFIDQNLNNQPIDDRWIFEFKGRGVNKYFAGTAVLMLPFFLVGVIISALTGEEITGHGLPFQLSLSLAVLFYWFVGLWFLGRLLANLGLKKHVIGLVLILLTLATNALYYLVEDVSASHIYSFACISTWLYFTKRYAETEKSKHLLFSAALLGLIVLIRPVNAIIVLSLPYLTDSWKALTRLVQNSLRRLLLPSLVFLFIVSIQLWLYWFQTDHFFVWSYTQEGFYLKNPAIGPFLFGFKRGWLIYTPFFLLLIPALIRQWKQNRFKTLSFLLLLFCLIYVLSSWWSWHYGGSFSSRPMIDFYALLVLPIAMWLDAPKKRFVNWLCAAFLVFTTILNITQTYQVHTGIASSDHMNFEKYTWTLGKVNTKYSYKLGGRDDLLPYHKSKKLLYEGPQSLDVNLMHWSFGSIGVEGGHSTILLDSNTIYNAQFRYQFSSVPDFDKFFVTMSLERKELAQNAASNAYVVIDVLDQDDERKHYDAFFINDHPDLPFNTWQSFNYSYSIQPKIKQGDQLKIYLWNKGGKPFLVRNIEMKIYGLK
ncbi:MAG: hypothetical protein WEC59_10545, partial [Salibacteraceae bacterium]